MRILILSALPFAMIAQSAHAAPRCALPATIPAAHAQAPGETRQAAIGGYLLSFSWSPEACYNAKRNPHEGQDTDIQCGKVNHFGLVLHGLWPEGNADNAWPQYCRKVAPASADTVRAMLCRTPSVSLIEHEWEKHGSCGWGNAESYFAQSSKLMDALRLPNLSSMTRGQVNASAVRRAFASANPSVPYDSIGIFANKGGWFEEIRLCLDARFHYRKCPAYSYGSADGDALKIARIR